MWHKQITVLRLITTVTVMSLCERAVAQNVCDDGFFGSPCKPCHCFNAEVCSDTGCADMLCAAGYTGPPGCQTECAAGTFGLNCSMSCHCQSSPTCLHVNGECEGGCDVDWTGSGCQTRLPRLLFAPLVSNVTCSSVTVTWLAWRFGVDIGDPPVQGYTLQQNDSDIIDIDHRDSLSKYSYTVRNLPEMTSLVFRVVANREEDDKKIDGRPGNQSEIVTLPKCEVSTTTTEPPTTTTQPLTTTKPVTTTTVPPTTTTVPPTTTTVPPTTTTEPATTTTIRVTTTIEPTTSTTEIPTTTTEITTSTILMTTTITLQAPTTPLNLSLTATSSSTIVVTWRPPNASTVDKYLLRYAVISTGNCQDRDVVTFVSLDVSPAATNYTIDGLLPWTQYLVTLTAANAVGLSNPPAAMTTVTQSEPPNVKVLGLNVTEVTSRSLLLSWDPVVCSNTNGYFRYYELEVTNRDTLEVSNVTVQQIPANVTQLVPHSNYSVRVRLVNDASSGSWSEVISSQTALEVPYAVSSLQSTLVTNESVALSWSAPQYSHILDSYNVTVLKVGVGTCGALDTSSVYSTLLDASAVNHVIHNLEPWTRYRLTISAQNKLGSGPHRVITVLTSSSVPTLVISEVNFTSVQSRRIELTWSSPSCKDLKGEFTQYHVTVRDVLKNIVVRRLTVVTNFAAVAGLIPSSRYGVSVAFETDGGIGKDGNEFFITTSVEKPPSVKNMTAIAASNTVIVISWLPPNTSNVITSYNITYQRLGTRGCDVNVGARNTSLLQVSGTANNATLEFLQPWSTYRIKIASSSFHLASEPVIIEKSTPESAPTALVQSMTTADITRSSASITWQGIPCPSRLGVFVRYDVHIENLRTGQARNVTSVPASHSVANLEPFTPYAVRVRVINNAGSGPWSAASVFTTLSQVPSPVTDVELNVTSSFTIEVTWRLPTNLPHLIEFIDIEASKVKVGSCATGGSQLQQKIFRSISSTKVMFTFSTLSAWTTYKVGVKTRNSIGSSTVLEKEAATPPSAPTRVLAGINFHSITSRFVKITWTRLRCEDSEAPLIGYEFVIAENKTSKTVLQLTDALNIVELPGLTPFTVYAFRIRIVNELGGGRWTDDATFRTLREEPNKVSKVLLNATTSSIHLSWDNTAEPWENVLGYSISWYKTAVGTCLTGGNSTKTHVNVSHTTSTYELAPVDYWATYRVEVSAFNEVGQSVVSVHDVVTQGKAPTATINVISHQFPSRSTIRFTWRELPCDQQMGRFRFYKARLTKIADGSVIDESEVSSASYVTPGLLPLTQYGLEIKFVNFVGEGSWGAQYTVLTLIDGTPNISGPSVGNISSSSAVVSWDVPPAAKQIVGYEVTYRKLRSLACTESSSGPVTSLNIGPSSNSVFLKNLHPWSIYEMTVLATNSFGKGEIRRVTVVTLQNAPSSAVANVKTVSVTTNQIELHWDPYDCSTINGNFSHYEVTVEAASIKPKSKQTLTKSVTFEGLSVFTEYTFKARVVNRVGPGPWSEPHSVTTLETVSGAPQNLQLTLVTPYTATFSWKPPLILNGVTLYYVILLKSPSSTLEFNATSPSATVQPLLPYTTYTVKVAAVNSAGRGDNSDSVAITTQDGVPGPPGDVLPAMRNMTCIQLTWEAPVIPNGIIQGYKIMHSVVQTHWSDLKEPDKTTTVVNDPKTSYLICNLRSSTKYIFQLSARTRFRGNNPYGYTKTAAFWTEQSDPPAPPPPVVKSSNHSRIVLQLGPAPLTDGSVISSYLVTVLEEVTTGVRRKRATNLDAPPGYVTAELPTTFQFSEPFVVGDGKRYGTYENKALDPDTRYVAYFSVVSTLEGLTKYAYSKTSQNVMTSPQPSMGVQPIIYYTAFPILALLILILFIVIVYLILRRRRGKTLYIDGDKSQEWLEYYQFNETKFNETADLVFLGHWSQIYNEDEPRYVRVDGVYVDPAAEKPYNQYPLTFEDEFLHLPHGQTAKWDAALRPENEIKNRFNHLLAYDHSAVILDSGTYTGSKYINANYINGFKLENQYIAAQSPFNEVTVDAFWQMIYQEGVAQIVMVTNLVDGDVIKCVEYWPEHTKMQYGDILVEMTDVETFANFVVRNFRMESVSAKSISKLVTQFQFTAWPIQGCLENPIPFLEFRNKIRAHHKSSDGPILVHCGTGVSTSGVFIAVDALLEQTDKENKVNVWKFVNHMRRDRISMVRTLKQYLFVYDVLLESLIVQDASFGFELKKRYKELTRVNPDTKHSFFRQQFMTLQNFTPVLTTDSCHCAFTQQNVDRNRFDNVCPPDEFRPVLRNVSHDYINAVFIDGYKAKNSFIITQTPLKETVNDFWHMVYQQNVISIVMMDDNAFKEATCARYVPVKNGAHRMGSFSLVLLSTESIDGVTVKHLRICPEGKKKASPRDVKHFQINENFMPEYNKMPKTAVSMLALMEMVEEWQSTMGMRGGHGTEEASVSGNPIVSMCMDGATHSGLYVAACCICERMKYEKRVDLFHTVKDIKRRRPQIVNTLDQYKYLHRVLWDYMNIKIHGLLPNGTMGTLSTLRGQWPDSLSSLYA